jgi:hypothetical protein
MTPRTKQLHIERITTNLPAAYTKFFFRNEQEQFVNIQDQDGPSSVTKIFCTCPPFPSFHPGKNREETRRGAFAPTYRAGLSVQQRRLPVDSTQLNPQEIQAAMDIKRQRQLQALKQRAGKLIIMNSSEDIVK